LVAAMIAFLPAADSLRLGLGVAGGAGVSAFLAPAHLFRCASAIARQEITEERKKGTA